MTNRSSVTEAPEHPGPSACRHYWVIQPASGPLSPGLCQVCGENREFKNYVDHAWDDYNLVSRSGFDGFKKAAQKADDRGTAGGDDEG